MSTKLTDEQMGKLPKWARDYFVDVARERDTALRALNNYVDTQTPSAFYIDELECTGEDRGPTSKRRHIQTHKITVQHNGVRLDVSINCHHPDAISLQWGSERGSCERHVAFIPTSFMAAELAPCKEAQHGK